METLENEAIDFDTAFDIECIIYSALEKTISQSIDDEMQKDASPLVIAKELMLKNILSRNIDGLEEEQYLTVGPEGKVYLCGSWLMRSVLSTDGKMKPILEHIKAVSDCKNIIFLPNKTGSELRKELWFAKTKGYSSYDLPRDCRIDPPQTGAPLGGHPGMMGAMPPTNLAALRPIEPTDEDVAELIERTIFNVLESTITDSIEEDSKQVEPPSQEQKNALTQRILARNMAFIKDSNYLTQTKDDVIYLCGEWLIRPVTVGGKQMPMIGYLKNALHAYTHIVYLPDKTGAALRKEMGIPLAP